MSRRTPARVKDILLEHISRDIKKLQSMQSDMSTVVDMVTNSNPHAHAICEHLDHVLMHGLREYDKGYWPFVLYFTHSEAVRTIKHLPQVTTDIGRGRAWLYMALNEQVVESYVRMFVENPVVAQEYYMRESFMRDVERLIVLQTLVSGLDFISFDMTLDCSYLDYGPSEPSSQLGINRAAELTPDIEPSFISAVTPQTRHKVPTVTGMLDSVFGYESPPRSDTKDESLSASYSEATSRERHRRSPDREPRTSLGTSRRGQEESEWVDIPRSQEPDEVEGESLPSQPSGLQLPPQANILDRMASLEEQQSRSGSKSLRPRSHLQEERLTQSLVVQGSHPWGHSGETGGGDWDELVAETTKVRKPKARKKKRKKAKGEKESPKGSRGKVPPGGSSQGSEERREGSVDRESQLTGTAEREEEEEEGGDMAATDSLTGPPSLTPSEPAEEPTPFLVDEGPTDPATGLGLSVVLEDEGGDDVGLHRPSTTSGAPLAPERMAVEETDNGVPLRVEEEKVWEEVEDVRVTTPVRTMGGPSLEDEIRQLQPPDQRGPDQRREEGREGTGKEGAHVPASHPSRLEFSPQLDDFEVIDSDALHGSWTAVGDTRGAEGAQGEESSLVSPITDAILYEGLPDRPKEPSHADKHVADVDYDDNTRLVFQLDVFCQPDEQIERLIQVTTPTGRYQQRTAFLLITTEVVYLLQRDGIEGHYSKEVGIKYSEFEHIVIGLGWQSLILVYRHGNDQESQKVVIMTWSEAVSRSIVNSIRTAAATCPSFQQSIPLNRDDESRVEAIEKELIKLGSHMSMDIVQYSLVNWEDLSVEDPPEISAVFNQGVTKSGPLLVKTTNVLGISAWKSAYFKLRDRVLRQYNLETDKVARNIYDLRKCGGCMRAHGESKPFALTVVGREGLVLAAANEEELTQWMQALCEAVTSSRRSPTPVNRKTCLSCAVLLTQNNIHVLQEDWSNETVQLVTTCEITDVNGISVDRTCPLYCTISHDHGDSQGVWLLCFSSELELGKFECALAGRWKDHFQIDLQVMEVSGQEVKARAHRAIELMQWSRTSSDSVSRGRTQFSYDPAF